MIILTLSALPAAGQLRDVVKSAEIDKLFAKAAPSLAVLTKNNYAVEFRVAQGASGEMRAHPEADEFWFVRSGAANITLAERQHKAGAGDVVNVPRSVPYRIIPSAGRFEYVALRVFPTERKLRIGIGAAPQPKPMPEVATKAQIDATFASAEKNVLLHSAGALLINHVIYKGTHGPWEVHQTCDDVYFLRLGTARAQLDGTLVNGKEDQPGEIRGTGVTGAREFTVGVGDMVVVPRNTTHFMDPGAGKLGYLLAKICD
jgi:mannose-6-phosphate isomerase-like protein (cupin superfamily)